MIGADSFAGWRVFALIRKKLLRYSELDADRLRVKKLIKRNKWLIESLHLFLYKYIGKLIRWQKIRHRYREELPIEGRMEMVRLHGCWLIFYACVCGAV